MPNDHPLRQTVDLYDEHGAKVTLPKTALVAAIANCPDVTFCGLTGAEIIYLRKIWLEQGGTLDQLKAQANQFSKAG